MTRRFLWALTALFTLAIALFLPYGSRGSAAEKLLDVLGVGGRQDLVRVEAAGAHRGLALEVVAHAGLLLLELPGTGDLEALLGPGVGLLLRHLVFLLGSATTGVADGGARPDPRWTRPPACRARPRHPPPVAPSPQHAVHSPRPWPRTCSSEER